MPKFSGRNKVTLIIERMDAKSRRLAKKFDELKFIYALYGLLDGLSTSYSTLMYFFNVADTATSSADAMNDWMGTSSGVAVAATETITLVVFSFLANIFDDKDEKAFKRYIAIAWPYCRDSIKGVKNAYKGVRSSLQTIGILSGHDLHNMIIPLGLALGVVSLLNRVCMRKFVKDDRVSKMKENTKLLSEIQGTAFHFLEGVPQVRDRYQYKDSYILVGQLQLYYVTSNLSLEEVPIANMPLFEENINKINPGRVSPKVYLSYKDIKTLVTSNGGHTPSISEFDRLKCDALRAQIKGQSDRLNQWALLGAAYGGVVDGLYLYMGALGLTALSPPAFMAMAVCSAIFSSMCVATRVYEEYDFQRKLKATKAKVEVALCCRELEALLGALKRVSILIPPPNDSELGPLINELRLSGNGEVDVLVEELKILWERFQPGDEAQKAVIIQKLKAVYDAKLLLKRAELESKRKDVRLLTASSGVLAVFAGFRNGLAVYGAITSIMFAVATINAIFLAPFPPAFLIAGVVVGMVCLVASLIQTIISDTSQLPDQTIEVECNRLFNLMASLKGSPIQEPVPPQSLNPSAVREAILESMDVPPPPQSDIQKWGEVFRSLGSGFSKGPRLLNFLRTMWPVVALNEGDEGTSVWLQVALACAVVQAVVFTLTAWTRGFGRDTPDVIKQPTWVIKSPDGGGSGPLPNGPVSLDVSSDEDAPSDGDSVVVARRRCSDDGSQISRKGSPLLRNTMFQKLISPPPICNATLSSVDNTATY